MMIEREQDYDRDDDFYTGLYVSWSDIFSKRLYIFN